MVDLCQVGNFIYTATSEPFQGVQGQDYIGWMLVHRATLFSDICLKKAFSFVTHPMMHSVTCLNEHGGQAGN